VQSRHERCHSQSHGIDGSQRAVSYFEIPCQAKDPNCLDKLPDAIPLGKGMQNVRLLVVNREDRTKLCGVGEVGELYICAASLAEGYMNDPKLTEEKFLKNWVSNIQDRLAADKDKARGEPWRKYYKGPRDRIYRTGDLGRYLPSGDVECTGRADLQVKIRGFRIELNEIDAHLSQHPLIRDCKPLLRRDGNEERTIISYLAVEMREYPHWLRDRGLKDMADEGLDFGATKVYMKRFRRMQTDMREHLQSRLSNYAVPTIFIVLNKLP
jgi:L-2-aminoadipate reductase